MYVMTIHRPDHPNDNFDNLVCLALLTVINGNAGNTYMVDAKNDKRFLCRHPY